MDTTEGSLRLGAHPIAGRVGASIDSIDLRDGLTPEQLDELHRLLADRGVVVFTNQRQLDPGGHRAFARQLGEIRTPPPYFTTLHDDGFPEIGVLRSEPGLGNGADTWHADVTWAPEPPRYSVAHIQVVPPAGGDTMWASQTLAYERLSPTMRRFLAPLTAEHCTSAGKRSYKGTQYKQSNVPHDLVSVHPVVHRHPVNGRLALSVNPTFTARIAELSERESAGVLGVLYDTITQPENVCRWQWSAGDVAIWDNQFVLHYAIYDYDEPRLLHRIEISGAPLVPAPESDVERDLVPA